tara:strand:+ start:2432 stop:2608 length:177 start_codon:yes stop_codon:yes gene_type:complete
MKLLFSIPEAANALSVGRTSIYSLINGGKLQTIKIGRRTLVPAKSLETMIAEQVGGGA